MHERLIEHINKHEGVEWVTMAEVRPLWLHYPHGNLQTRGTLSARLPDIF
jgi:hypothetical protein